MVSRSRTDQAVADSTEAKFYRGDAETQSKTKQNKFCSFFLCVSASLRFNHAIDDAPAVAANGHGARYYELQIQDTSLASPK